ncbi:MAG TPA: transcription-repair coupling factor [Anaerolineae bacterium]|nr:transcription-repair coupling factor [Anaerolineae bacterium]
MNVTGILQILEQLPVYEELLEQLKAGAEAGPLDLPTSFQAAFLAHLHRSLDVPILFVTGEVSGVSSWQQALEAWLPPTGGPWRWPEPTPLPYERGPWSERSRQGRIRVLADLLSRQQSRLPQASGQPPLIVTSARALLQKTIPQRQFLLATRVLKQNQLLSLDKTMAHWLDIGYEPAPVVEAPGQFSRRGGIIDIYPLSASYPIRIELFGDEIDTLRHFDPATQRSLGDGEDLTAVVIPPAREALPKDGPAVASWLGSVAPEKVDDLPAWQDDIVGLETGRAMPNLEYYLPYLYTRPGNLLDYLPEDVLIVIDDYTGLEQAAAAMHVQARQFREEQVSLPPDFPSPLMDWLEFAAKLASKRNLILGKGEGDLVDKRYLELAYSVQPGPRFGGQTRPLLLQLRHAQQANERTIVVSRQAQRLAQLWEEEMVKQGEVSPLTAAHNEEKWVPVEHVLTLPKPGTLTFVQGSLAEGFSLEFRGDRHILLHLLTDAEIFGWNRPAPRRHRYARPLAPETRFSDIEAGDYIVHLEYGIGRFGGLVVRGVGGAEREYLLVEYANSDTLYVPVHHADRLSKWIGNDDNPPRMHRLGERSWKTSKAKAREAADELADELLSLYASREMVVGHAFAEDNEWVAELEASFPHQETEDQLRVIHEVKTDMEAETPMDRLVCGDVGYGKTEVALRAAFKAAVDGKQVAILVPTTVLAQQHYLTFRERLRPFPVYVDMLSRFRTPTRQKKIIKSLREGQVDIIIGTHRLLSDDVSFNSLGLLIIDEEQRFGVRHKEMLKQWRQEIDVLTMTATPIPRTLYMGLTGVRDISIIDTAPAERLPVQTYVGTADDTILKRALLRELDRGGQVYVVHNRVQTIQIVFNRIQRLLPDARIALGHGQMKERELEDVMMQFAAQEIDILVCTTIIESGVDIPNANTLIVDKAEQFGLSQLYQLRGRVGRGDRRAYAYFFHGKWHALNPDAQARLEAIAEETQLGAGYNIAMRDLELRGAGDLLGGAQSGHISAIGLDLYTRLLAQAVKRQKAKLRGETLPEHEDVLNNTLIDLPLPAYIPPDYVPDAALRLRLYRRMAQLDSLPDMDEMAEELADRFGAIPDPVHNLLYQLRIKILARQAQAISVTSDGGQIKIKLDLENVSRFHLQRYLANGVRVSRDAVWLKRELTVSEWGVALVQVLERLYAFQQEGMVRKVS